MNDEEVIEVTLKLSQEELKILSESQKLWEQPDFSVFVKECALQEAKALIQVSEHLEELDYLHGDKDTK